MNTERIKQLAYQTEFINKKHNGDEWRWGYIDPELSAKLEKFAELIAAEEREACALAVEQAGIEGLGTLAAAAAIRARGNE